MSKRVAVIDLGSNSARMAIFERTSRLGFFILREYKVKVRLGEGAYEKGGVLQDEAMSNVLNAFREFKYFLNIYKVSKILCTGTSALRDAPNSNTFINLVKRELGFNLRVISGDMEAFYGGIAALNLLSPLDEATTIDIGGGSTELAKISNGRIVDLISLDVGTVRLKELFFDKDDIDGALRFTQDIINKIPPHFASRDLIAIGGSLRAISSSIMQLQNHQIRLVHNFTYKYSDYANLISKIATDKELDLKSIAIKKDRFDTIRQGAMIFSNAAKILKAKTIYTSGVGIREGVFLVNLLGPNLKSKDLIKMPQEHKIAFPKGFNPSLRSIQDRFAKRDNSTTTRHAKALFEVLAPLHKLKPSYLNELIVASKLYNIGRSIGFYSENAHSGYLVKNALNYGYTHQQKALIAAMIEYQGKAINTLGENLLPDIDTLRWLSFLLGLAGALSLSPNISFDFFSNTLYIKGAKNFFMLKDEIRKLIKPAIFAISFE
ncbi:MULTISPECIES: Ppx/GppA phosphatase family protein [Campylobacter]|uniref:Guanosine-5'-triphosphate, 3'-diphosphate pyrophosphatase n=1 Tax=Campylobacter porcelli TaxID=1660073 RepID=A0A1X9SY14_9BACT|nr:MULTISPECIES: Ppx/GppA phosphatase family protein [unclassified Campylobacter]ARR01192.1 guanosine-5'-triphosphate, 3'-diphosphate pyrophosphatase [Campylobacter sp. RM6137]MCR8679160.1 Ppx/GppA family phosphatase [Campylobacter sp. RM19072]MCR8696014.1 Ppx/GppA family phosphatase [Campylobacter sp. RM19073]